MKRTILVPFVLLGTVQSLSLPTTLKDYKRQLFSSVGLVVATSLPISAHAVEVIKIDANIPALIQIAKDNKDIALSLAQQTASVVKITDYPKSYANLINFARDVVAGDVFVEVNGVPIDVSLLSEKGAIDIDLSTEVGDISVTVSSQLLPKLPFLSKRVVPQSDVAIGAPSKDSVVEPAKAPRTRTAVAIQATDNAKGAMLDQPFILDPFQQGWTVKQVLGSTTLGLGIAYGASYAYYIKSQEDEGKAAAKKKIKAAANKAAVAVPEKEGALATTLPVAVESESPIAVKRETISSESITKSVTSNTTPTAKRVIQGKVGLKNIVLESKAPIDVKRKTAITENSSVSKSPAKRTIQGEVGIKEVLKSLDEANKSKKSGGLFGFWKRK